MKFKRLISLLFVVVCVMSLQNTFGVKCDPGEHKMTGDYCPDCVQGCYCLGADGDTSYALDPKGKISWSQFKEWCKHERDTCDHQGQDGYDYRKHFNF